MKSVVRFVPLIIPVIAVFVIILCISGMQKDSAFVKAAEPKYFIISGFVIPDTLFFAGERVPLNYSDIRESLDKELQINAYWHSQTIMIIKRAKRYFPIIDSILKKNGLPSDFKYLAVAESGLQNISSPSNAEGFWQFLKATAKESGLEVNEFVDERYHLEKSTEAFCKFINVSYKLFGNWTTAAASYNEGRQAISKQLEFQKEDNYYNLSLFEETSRYIFRMISFKLIMQNPQKYSFIISEESRYKPYKYNEICVDSTIANLTDFAIQQGANYKTLKMLNPWLRNHSLPNKSHKLYTIKIPIKGFRETND